MKRSEVATLIQHSKVDIPDIPVWAPHCGIDRNGTLEPYPHEFCGFLEMLLVTGSDETQQEGSLKES